MEVDSIPQPARRSIEQIESADLLVGILADLKHDDVVALCEALRTIPGNPRTVVLWNPRPSISQAEASDTPAQDSLLSLIPWPLGEQHLAAAPIDGLLMAYQSIFAISQKLGVRGCCVIASNLQHAPSRWVCQLTEPVLSAKFDLVVPCYARRKFEGLLNNSIVSPLMRSLYGRRIQNPLGPDVGVSQRLFQRLLAPYQNGRPPGSGLQLLASLAPQAICDNLQVCQAYLGARVYPPLDWTNASSLLAEILAPVFLAMERNAAYWQRVRTSTPVAALNEPTSVPQTTASVEIGRLFDSFQLGNRDLQEIWRLVMPPTTLLELQRLTRLPLDNFAFPDELWVRIIYDFALACRLRTINRDHLLRSLTPLYLGWVAFYAREMEAAETTAVERRLERLSLAYEAGKPYLVSRWRWPDRFNP